MNCPNADGLWGFLLLFSFLLGCGVNFAQLTLEVGKGGERRGGGERACNQDKFSVEGVRPQSLNCGCDAHSVRLLW